MNENPQTGAATEEIPAKAVVKDKPKQDNQAVFERALKNIQKAESSDGKQIKDAMGDLRFSIGEQWDAKLKKAREEDGKPCLTINLMREKLNQVKGDHRLNKPQIKVIPYDDEADPETAEILNGHIRAILNNSDAELASDVAFDSSVDCGRGAFRIVTEYEDEMVFNRVQVIKVEPILNVFSVRFDPGAKQYDKQDGKFFSIHHDIPIDDYNAMYPGKPSSGIYTTFALSLDKQLTSGWATTETVRVAEYFERVEVKVRIALLEDGTTVRMDDLPETGTGGAQFATDEAGLPLIRTATESKILWYKLNGSEILEGPRTFPSRFYPIFFVWGEETNINGERYVQGMVRPGKDSQIMINWWESKTSEVVMLAPTAPWLATAKQIPDEYQDLYNAAAKGDTVSVLYYKPDDLAGASKPERVVPPSIPTGMENRAAVNKDNLKSTMGIYDSSLGANGPEESGVAIGKRQHQTERGTFHFTDNEKRTFKTLGNCLLDMIPRIYDTERTVRILGLDGEPQRRNYGRQGEGYDAKELKPEERIYDPKMGKYDVTIEVGPSYATRRQESSDVMSGFVQSAPITAPILIPRVARSMDFPDSDDIADELELVVLPPELRAELDALRQRRKMGLQDEEEQFPEMAIGPDGQPIDPEMPPEEMMVPPEPVDPAEKYRTVVAQTEAANAMLEFREKYKAAGYTDEQIDAMLAAIEAEAGEEGVE